MGAVANLQTCQLLHPMAHPTALHPLTIAPAQAISRNEMRPSLTATGMMAGTPLVRSVRMPARLPLRPQNPVSGSWADSWAAASTSGWSMPLLWANTEGRSWEGLPAVLRPQRATTYELAAPAVGGWRWRRRWRKGDWARFVCRAHEFAPEGIAGPTLLKPVHSQPVGLTPEQAGQAGTQHDHKGQQGHLGERRGGGRAAAGKGVLSEAKGTGGDLQLIYC